MREHRFSLTRILPYKDRIVDFVLIREKRVSETRILAFLCSNNDNNNKLIIGPFKNYVTCVITFFIPFTLVTLCQFYSFTFLCVIHKKWQIMEWQKRRYFVYMAGSVDHVMSKEVENRIFRHNHIFRHTRMYKQPMLTK